MKSKLVVSVLSLIIILALMGCAPKGDYQLLEYKNSVLEENNQELTNSMAGMNLLADESNIMIATLTDNITVVLGKIADLNTSVSALQTERETLKAQVIEQEERASQAELELSEVSVPGDFPSRSVLQQWADNNIQRETPYLGGGFQSALAVQKQGLEDGYLISIVYDIDDTDQDYGWILCAALAGGKYYLWFPETGNILNYGDFLERENGI